MITIQIQVWSWNRIFMNGSIYQRLCHWAWNFLHIKILIQIWSQVCNSIATRENEYKFLFRFLTGGSGLDIFRLRKICVVLFIVTCSIPGKNRKTNKPISRLQLVLQSERNIASIGETIERNIFMTCSFVTFSCWQPISVTAWTLLNSKRRKYTSTNRIIRKNKMQCNS